jgi:HEAT repeat protein
MPLFGPPNVEKMRARGDIKGLIQALNHPKVGQAAVAALAQIGGTRVAEQVIAHLIGIVERGEPEEYEEPGRDTLEKIGAAAVDPLIACLKHPHQAVPARAAAMLGRIRDPRAVEPLVAMLGERSGARSSAAAAKALGEIGDARAVAPLVAALNDGLSETRMEAASALGKLGDPRTVQPLCRALNDDVGFVREQVVEALDKLGYFRAAQPPIAALRSRHEDVRAAAARLVPKSPSPS